MKTRTYRDDTPLAERIQAEEDKQGKRAAKVAAMLAKNAAAQKRWLRKLKLATTKLRKLRAQARRLTK